MIYSYKNNPNSMKNNEAYRKIVENDLKKL